MSINSAKYTLKILILICFTCFITDKITYFILDKISDKVYTGQTIGKVNHYLEIKENKRLLIFGSSRANHNIDPNILDTSSFNIGLDGRNIAYVTTLVKMIEKKTPQTILIQIDPEYIFDKNYKGEDIEPLEVKYHRNAVVKEEIDKLNINNPFHYFFWSILYNNKTISIVRSYLKPAYDYRTYNGYDPIDIDENQKKIFRRILSQKKVVKCQDSLQINKLFYNYLVELKEFSKNKNKKLIFFTSPVYHDYCKEDNLELSKLAQHIKIDYSDFTDLFLKDNSESYWKDEIHLSRIGAEIFTKKFKEQLSTYTQ